MIEQLLTLARISGGAGPSLTDEVDLGEVVREVAAAAAFEGGAANRTVTWSTPIEAKVAGARELLHSAIENVVRNALRHTPEETQVRITIESICEMAVVAVRDHGPGVPKGALERLFETFCRVPEVKHSGGDGAGLGLAITRQVVEAHGGWVKASNAAKGGLEVRIALPLIGRLPASA